MIDAPGMAAQNGAPWYEDERWLREPVFDDVPFEQSGWQPIVEVLEQVNLLKARLLVSLYEARVRIAYQRYRAIREEEFENFRAERPEAEHRNDALREQIRGVEQAMEQVRARWQPELDELRAQLYSAWQDAYAQAAQVGINLRGDPLMGDGEFAELIEQSSANHTNATPDAERASPAHPETPHLPTMPTTPVQQPPSLTPAEVMHAQNLPGYQGRLIPKPFWAILIGIVGLGWGMGLTGAIGLITPGQPIHAPLLLTLTLLAGVALTYLWTRALWGATATIAELYHLFGWHEGKARRAAWSLGATLILLVLTAGLLTWLLMSIGRTATTLGGWTQLALWLTALLMLPLLACALLEGFLEGRSKPFGHQIAACITQHEREQFRTTRHAHNAESNEPIDTNIESLSQVHPGTPSSTAPSEVQQAAWVAIRRYRALYRQYHHLKSEMEQALASYREQIEQLKAEMRPIYPALPPHSRNRIMLAYREWEQMYHSYLQHLADALRECQGGEELAAIVLAPTQNQNAQPF